MAPAAPNAPRTLHAALIAVLAALLPLAAPAAAAGPEARRADARPLDRFVAVPGQQEFSGRVLVLPRTEDEVLAALDPRDADRAAARAVVEQTEARLAALRAEPIGVADLRAVAVPAGETDAEFAARLDGLAGLAFAHPDWIVYPLGNVNDPFLNFQWQHDVIGSRTAWDTTTGVPGVVVAVCDTGIDLDHPDLVNQIVPGYNSVTQLTEAQGGLVDDINGHGTFIAGLVAAEGDNGVGVAGIGYDLRVMPIRVSNRTDGSASLSALVGGARWAVDNGARIANVSYSGVTNAAVQVAGADIKQAGGLLFWAAGNDGASLGTVDHPDVVVVGSTTSSDNRSGFSNFGPAVDVTAPGSSVYSTRVGGFYGSGSGTSYANPVAAAVAALAWSVDPFAAPQTIEDALYNSAADLGDPGEDDFFGAGRVDAAAVVSFISPPTAPPGAFSLTSPAVGASGLDIDPLLEWTPSAEASLYSLVVDDDPAFGSPVLDIILPAGVTSYAVPFTMLAYDTTYSWRVTATNLLDDRDAAPAVSTFTTKPAPLPGPFQLLGPADGSAGLPSFVGLEWTASEEAFSYRVRVDDDPGLASPIIDRSLDAPATTFSVSGLPNDFTLYWSVDAVGPGGVTPATDGVFSFTTQSSPFPAPFQLLAPAVTDRPGTGPLLVWSRSDRATGYSVVIATDNDYANVVFSDSIAASDDAASTVSLQVPAGALDWATRYYWRVEANNFVGTTTNDDPAGAFITSVEFPGLCPGDIDGDADTDFSDFVILGGSFGRTIETAPHRADLDADGAVTVADFFILATGFGCDGSDPTP